MARLSLEISADDQSRECDAWSVIITKVYADDAALKKAGVQFLELKGKVREAYNRTIYGSTWAENDNLAKTGKFIIDDEKLKAKMYSGPGN